MIARSISRPLAALGSCRRTALIALIGATAIAPPVAESAAVAAIDAHVARCTDGSVDCGGVAAVDLDAGGLQLGGAWARRRGWTVETKAVEIRPDPSGVVVHVDGLAIRRSAPVRGDAGVADPPAAKTVAPKPAASTSRRFDIPITVVAFGDIDLPRAHGATVTLHDPVVTWRPRQPLSVRTEATIEHPRGRVQTVTPLVAHVFRAPLRAHVEGAVSLGGGPAVATSADMRLHAATHAPGRRRSGMVSATLDDGAGGSLRVEVDRGESTQLHLTALRFGLDRFGDIVSSVTSAHGIDASQATVDGAVDLAVDDGVRVHLDNATIDGLVIDHRRLSREPVRFDALVADGDASMRDHEVGGQLTFVHRGVQLHVAAARSNDRIEASVELPTVPCQRLLDALPEGMAGVLDGTRLGGTIDGRFDMSLSLPALAAARALPEPPIDAAPPGTVELSFPMLQRCEVLADSAAVDLQGMRRAYRHRFVDDRGRPHERVMAPGAPGYAPLSTVPLVARAFITLEDTKFFDHDGFDREHIRKAFWHDIIVGRVARGASTITQQAARNLWLGVDRSASRKLQEAFLAARLEAELPKSRILELYLNVIELGPGIHGIEDAAMYHFGKPATDLGVLEALHLASMAPAPRALSKKFADGKVDKAWMDELRDQVRRMYAHGWITHAQAHEAIVGGLFLRKHD